MTSIREFLDKDPLRSATLQVDRHLVGASFGKYLSQPTNELWSDALIPFMVSTPLCYWRHDTIQTALEVLEKDPHRTIQALEVWSMRVGIGFEHLLRRSRVDDYENQLDSDSAEDIVRLVNEFHPEYLRRCEYVFTNLIVLYWAVLKKGDVRGKYDIASAIPVLESRNYKLLLNGYEDFIRNKVAHGEIALKNMNREISYGTDQFAQSMYIADFTNKFDELRRTINSLGIAIVLFLARKGNCQEGSLVPSRLIALAVSSRCKREDMSVTGVVESTFTPDSKQLYVAMRTNFRGRSSILLDCLRVSYELISAGISNYVRHLYSVSNGKQVRSLVIIQTDRLEQLIREDAPWDRKNEVIGNQQLLWYDEPRWMSMVRAFRISLSSNFKLRKAKFIHKMQVQGYLGPVDKYRIRQVENFSVAGIGRINIYAVLTDPEDMHKQEVVQAIIENIVHRFSTKVIPTNPSDLISRVNLPGLPSYIWLRLYTYDGPIRWLKSNNWSTGNLIAMAEKVKGSKPPILIKKPEVVYKGIRIKYSM